jgi:hypothetical protein
MINEVGYPPLTEPLWPTKLTALFSRPAAKVSEIVVDSG